MQLKPVFDNPNYLTAWQLADQLIERYISNIADSNQEYPIERWERQKNEVCAKIDELSECDDEDNDIFEEYDSNHDSTQDSDHECNEAEISGETL